MSNKKNEMSQNKQKERLTEEEKENILQNFLDLSYTEKKDSKTISEKR